MEELIVPFAEGVTTNLTMSHDSILTQTFSLNEVRHLHVTFGEQ